MKSFKQFLQEKVEIEEGLFNSAIKDPFVKGYLEALMFVDHELDEFTISDFTQKSLKQAIEDCEEFRETNDEDLRKLSDSRHLDDEDLGRLFAYSRNGEGTGFDDEGTTEAQNLQVASKDFNPVTIIVHNGKMEIV